MFVGINLNWSQAQRHMTLCKQIDMHYQKNTNIAYIDYTPDTDLECVRQYIIQQNYHKTYDFWTDSSRYDKREWICMRHKSFNKMPRDGSEKMSQLWDLPTLRVKPYGASRRTAGNTAQYEAN